MKFKKYSAVFALVLVGGWLSGGARADGFPVTRIPAPGGEVVFANPGEREEMYDQLHYAAARRAGDFVYLSGVEAGPFQKGDRTDVNALKVQLRRAFEAIRASLVASGADFSQVVQMETFHNCHNKHNFTGDFQAQLDCNDRGEGRVHEAAVFDVERVLYRSSLQRADRSRNCRDRLRTKGETVGSLQFASRAAPETEVS